jgi:nitronate monooxygenase
MSIPTPLTQLLGIKHPILLAPMGGVAGGRLAAAVSSAGGFGLIGPGYQGAEWIGREFEAAGDVRVGVGFITWHLATDPSALDAALALGATVIMLSFGDPTPFFERSRRAGAKVIVQVQTLRGAKDAVRLGADAIVAQGTEAGGHGSARALFSLVPAVVDAVHPIPVVAAGGISDGRGLAAALSLGASGILLGTRFYAAEESLGHPDAKARIVAGSGDSTLRTTVFDLVRGIDWPAPFTGRALQNDFTRTWHGRERELAAQPTERERYASAAGANEYDTAALWAGEGVDLIDEVEPAARIIERIVSQAHLALDRARRGE